MINVEKGKKLTEKDFEIDNQAESHNRKQAFFNAVFKVIIKSIPIVYWFIVIVILGLPIIFLGHFLKIGAWDTLLSFWWKAAGYVVTFLGGILFEKKMKW